MCKLFIDADPALWASHTRSFRMDGMVTSVRLEDMFWRALEGDGLLRLKIAVLVVPAFPLA